MSDKSFIEVQFPVSKISKESYKERKAGSSQTLTPLGKWWGRKPLILVRATVIGLLMPSSENPQKDRDIFLKILTMDNEGLELRKDKSISTKDVYKLLDEVERNQYFENEIKNKIIYKKGITQLEKKELQNIVFNRMSYDEKLKYCCRPEQVNVRSTKEWDLINEHLGTNANSIQELTRQLGEKKFGRVPKIGDCFAGGGSIPFESARIGSEVYASDLNPIAALLNWANLKILGKEQKELDDINNFQERVYDKFIEQINEWKIEENEKGWRAKTYLYCNEVVCPECKTKVPLLPNMVISTKNNVVAELIYNHDNCNYDIDILTNVNKAEIDKAKSTYTINKSGLNCPKCNSITSISALRKDKKYKDGTVYGLRKWEKDDLVPRVDDVFNERLYCIKYMDKFDDKKWNDLIKKNPATVDSIFGNTYYIKPTENDIKREEKVYKLLKERFESWQNKGYIPSTKIEEGEKTNEPIRTRGWNYWNHLFNPRQLLLNGLLAEISESMEDNIDKNVITMLSINKCADFNSRLGTWDSGRDYGVNVFLNQALNATYNYPVKTCLSLYNLWMNTMITQNFDSKSTIEVKDARSINDNLDIWVTDPPYADAINYHELSEFFLAWDKNIESIFPDWYIDSKRVLAVKGKGYEFNRSMIEVYSNLAKNMTDNGMQVVMFTHQDVKVWAELALVLWASGLQVTSAWNIATETESGGLKGGGNYVKGTVILVLRKQNSDYTAYLDELYPEIEDEVKYQIDSMRDLDDKEDPNFTDSDYLLAAYAASLKVLTSYKNIEDIDVKYELSKSDSNSPIVNIINEAVKIAFDYLTPSGFDTFTWKTLLPEERFYIKGLDTEKDGVYSLNSYQELGRGFGVKEYSDMMASSKANHARLKTASEFAMKHTNENSKFGQSLLRNVLIALYKSSKEEDATKGKAWLRNEVEGYWNERSKIIEILDYIKTLEHIENMNYWEEDAKSARILVELVRNDGV